MDRGTIPLSALEQGRSAAVAEVVLAGPIRRRLQDLGIIPGATIRCAYAAPSGSPAAYDIFGAVIALRRGDAESVLVLPWD